MNKEIGTRASFGERMPPRLWQYLVGLCHRPAAPVVSRLCAPVVRKCLLTSKSLLPIDLRLEDFNLRCHFTDNYSEKKFVFTPWRYDLQERKLLTESLREGGVFVDIGANVGLYTLTAAKALSGREGRIVAFEPNPATLHRFKINIEANPDLFEGNLRLDILPIGIADRDSTFRLQVDRENLGASSMTSDDGSQAGMKEEDALTVQCRPLLEVLAALDVQSIDALKIDIEGMEDLALGPYLDESPDTLLAATIIIENSQHLWSLDLFGAMELRGYQRIHSSRMNSVFARPAGRRRKAG